MTIIPNQPLTSDSVGELRAGDLLRHSTVGVVVFSRIEGDQVHYISNARDPSWTDIPTAVLSFIGRPDDAGWIHAPEGGWAENPVPGCEVFIRAQEQESAVAHSDWTWAPDIIAFRLAAPSVERDLGSSADADTHRATDDPWAVLEGLAKAALAAKRDNARWEALDALEAAANPSTVLKLIEAARASQVGMERGNAVRNEPKAPAGDGAAARERLALLANDLERYNPWGGTRSQRDAADLREILSEIDRLRACVEADGARLAEYDRLIDFWFSPRGAGKAAEWEGLDGDGPALSADAMLNCIRRRARKEAEHG